MAKTIKLLVLCAVCALTIPRLFAQDAEGVESTAPAQETDETKLLLDGGAGAADTGGIQSGDRMGAFTLWDFLRMVLILAAVVAAIYLLFRILKKKASPKMQDADLFKVLSTQALAANRSLHLVEVGRQLFLVGASENAVSLISEISDKETLDDIRLKSAAYKEGEKMTFVEKLQGFFKPVSGLQSPPAKPNEFFKKQRERLKRF